MDFLVRRGRGLDPAVLGWLMGTLGVGPGIGEVHFLAGVDTVYYSWLRDDMRVDAFNLKCVKTKKKSKNY